MPDPLITFSIERASERDRAMPWRVVVTTQGDRGETAEQQEVWVATLSDALVFAQRMCRELRQDIARTPGRAGDG